MWNTVILPTLISAGGSWLIILVFWSLNYKRKIDEETNKHTQLINEISNLNSKLSNESVARDNHYTSLENEINNIISKINNDTQARENHYTSLENEINNIISKINNDTQARDDQYKSLRNEIINLNSKFDNRFERFFIEIGKLRTNVETNTQKIESLTSATNTNGNNIGV